MKKKRVFLGGTTNNSNWRDLIISLLKIDYFNPVVDNWNDEAKQNEIYERNTCDFCLYVITPKMKGVYSIAEAVEDSIKRPAKNSFCVLNSDDGVTFDERQIHSLTAVAEMIKRNGGIVCDGLLEASCFLNYISYLSGH